METTLQDIRYGLRMLLKNPGFTAIAIIALALGIGANTAIFSVVSAVLLRPLPYPEPEQIVAVWSADATKPDSQSTFSMPDFMDLRAQNQVFSGIGAYRTEDFAVTESGGPAAHAQGAMVTADVLALLRVNPVLGRVFTADDDKPGARNVILSHELWQRRFGGDRNMLERRVLLDGVAYQVIGIMPEGFRFPIQNKPVEFWIPASMQFEVAPGQEPNTTPGGQRGMHYLKAVARLKPGVTPEQAQANAKSVMTALAQQYPDTNKSFNSAKVNPLLADITADVKPALLVLLGAAACVLLIACVNVANLLLARATSRQKEIGIRAALGASRVRILRQLLTESGVLALAGGIAGMLLATWGTAALASMLPRNFPRAAEIDPDIRVLAFTALVSLVTGVLFGMAPAWRVSRPDVVTALNETGRGSSETARGRRLRGGLVIAEMVLAFVLLVGAGLLIRSFWQLQKVELGFSPQGVMTAVVSLPDGDGGPQTTVRNVNFYNQLMERAATLPGVQSVSAITPLPLSGSNWGTGVDIAGRPTAPSDRPVSAVRIVTPGYFKTMGIAVRKGRDFDARDKSDSPGAVIINETFARMHFPNEDPLGKRMTPQMSMDENEPREREIVGVVADVKFGKITTESKAELYMPHTQAPLGAMTIVARMQNNPESFVTPLRQTVERMDKDLPVYEPRTMEQYLGAAVAQPKLNMTLLVIFSAVAVVLTGIGIYGVMAFSVAQRKQEIGIRMALGAQKGDVLRMIVGQGLRLVIAAMVIGLFAAFALTKSLASLLYGVGATDIVTLTAVGALLAVIATVACWLPARRASGVDPITALRAD